MASVERATECTICFEIFVNPKLLPCRHSYCEKCIGELTKGSKLQCPLCKSFCDVDQIVHDFQTENFVQAFQELEEEFNRKLDEATATIHPEPSAPPIHEVTAKKKCELCKLNEIAFWCAECKQWICMQCKTIHLNTTFTKDHRIEKMSEKIKEVESLLQTEINGLKVKIDEFQMYIKTLQAEKKNAHDMQLRTLQQSKELRAQCILEMNNAFNRIDHEILTATDKYSSQIERKISKQQKCVINLETKCKSLLASVQNKDPKLTIDVWSEIKQTQQLVRTTKTPDVRIGSIAIKLKRLREWSAQAVDLEIQGGNIKQKVAITISI